MAKFSIKNALEYGFSAYAQNLVLMLLLGVTIAVSYASMSVVPNFVAGQLGVKAHAVSKVSGMPSKQVTDRNSLPHHSMRPAQAPPAHASKIVKIHHALKEVGKGIHHEIMHKTYPYFGNDPINLVILFLVWLVLACIYLLIHMGLMRIALDISDKKATSYARLFSQKDLMLPYIGLSIVYMLLIICIIFGSIISGVILGGLLSIPLVLLLGDSGAAIGVGIGAIAAMIVMFKFMTRYVFSFYCLIDKKMGIHKALTCTYEITKGSVVKLIILSIIISLPFMIGGTVDFHMRIGKMVANDSYHAGLVGKLIIGFIAPWYALCFVHVYRKLSRG